MTKEEVCDYIREYSEACVRTHYDRPETEPVSEANGECWSDVLTASIDRRGRIWVSDGYVAMPYGYAGGGATREGVEEYVDNWMYAIWEQDDEA